MLGVSDDLDTGGIENLVESRQSQTGTADLGGRGHVFFKIVGGIDLLQSKFLAKLG
jgi:hypothetical protein